MIPDRAGFKVHYSKKIRRFIVTAGADRMYRSRLMMECFLGRPLSYTEVICYKNGDSTDDRPENLEVMERPDHVAHHYQQAVRDGKPWGNARLPSIRKPCQACGQEFDTKWAKLCQTCRAKKEKERLAKYVREHREERNVRKRQLRAERRRNNKI